MDVKLEKKSPVWKSHSDLHHQDLRKKQRSSGSAVCYSFYARNQITKQQRKVSTNFDVFVNVKANLL